jgi:single-strand DNA-binding protein
MASLNKVILIGNLVADPELKKTPSGVSVTSFRIAVGRRFTKDEAQQADFIDIVAWRNTAEFITKYFNKGKSILICGSIQTRSWTDQNGQKRYSVEVVADEASFVERKSDEQNTSGTPMIDTSTDGFVEVPSDEDLPF